MVSVSHFHVRVWPSDWATFVAFSSIKKNKKQTDIDMVHSWKIDIEQTSSKGACDVHDSICRRLLCSLPEDLTKQKVAGENTGQTTRCIFAPPPVKSGVSNFTRFGILGAKCDLE